MQTQDIDWNQAVQDTLATHEKEKQASTAAKNQTKYEVDLKKYFAITLPDGVNSGEVILRILPLSNQDLRQFHVTAKFHSIKLGDNYVKLYDPAQDGEESPLNDMSKLLYASGEEEDKKLAGSYRSRDFYIMKVIVRGLEHEGVKFWRFNRVTDGSGIMDKLDPLMKRLNDKKPGSGAIWRPDSEGRDLVLTLVRDTSKSKKGFAKVSSIIVEDPSPLSTNPEQTTAWLNDPITWKDVYKKKPIEYLRIVAEGSEPIWDKDAKKFIAKASDYGNQSNAFAKTSFPIPPTNTENDSESESIAIDDLPF